MSQHDHLQQPGLSVTVSVSGSVTRLGPRVLSHQGPQGVAAVEDLAHITRVTPHDHDADLLDVRLGVVHHLLAPVVAVGAGGLVGG